MAVLVENIPDRLGFAREQGDRTHTRSVGQGFGETVDAVFVGALAGGDGCPKHRAEHGVNRRHVAVNAAGDQTGQVRELTRLEQRADHLPISRVPADEQQASLGHGKRVSSGRLCAFRIDHGNDSRMCPEVTAPEALLAGRMQAAGARPLTGREFNQDWRASARLCRQVRSPFAPSISAPRAKIDIDAGSGTSPTVIGFPLLSYA